MDIKKAGLKLHGFFIIGYPGETIKDIEETKKFLRKCKFNLFFLNNFQPLPGTPVYEELLSRGEISPDLFPKNYSGGERAYTPKELKNFNFPLFILKEYIYWAVSNPLNILYMFKVINPMLIAKKIFLNIKNSLRQTKKQYGCYF